jgi:hypothetical protein
MKNQNTKTTTEFAVYVEKADGTWKPLGSLKGTREQAEEQIAAHNQLAREYSNDFTYYPNYKIMKRTVVTTFGDWSEA